MYDYTDILAVSLELSFYTHTHTHTQMILQTWIKQISRGTFCFKFLS